MPSLPPASAYRRARQLHQAALEAQRPSGITINGVFYACAVELGAVEWIPTNGGSARGQKLRADILKTTLATPPSQKTVVTHEQVDFKVQDIGGQNAGDVSWVIHAVRWMD